MKKLLKAVSFIGLGLMFVSALLVFNDRMTTDTYRVLILAGTALWFGPVPFWMKRRLHHSE
jgi:hypothetical protein